MLSTENAFEHVFEDEDGLSAEDDVGGGGGDGGRWEDVELAELEVEVPLLRAEGAEDGVTATPVGTLASTGEAASAGVALALLSGAAAAVK